MGQGSGGKRDTVVLIRRRMTAFCDFFINSMSENQNMFVPSFEPSQELDPEGFSAINDDDIPF